MLLEDLAVLCLKTPRRCVGLQEQVCSPAWPSVTPGWLLQNTHGNEDRNCSSGLGKVEGGSGSTRQSRHRGHRESGKPGRLPVSEAKRTRQDQGGMEVHPSSHSLPCGFLWKGFYQTGAVLSCWSAWCGDEDTSVCSSTAPRGPAPAMAMSPQTRALRTSGTVCCQKLKELG